MADLTLMALAPTSPSTLFSKISMICSLKYFLELYLLEVYLAIYLILPPVPLSLAPAIFLCSTSFVYSILQLVT